MKKTLYVLIVFLILGSIYVAVSKYKWQNAETDITGQVSANTSIDVLPTIVDKEEKQVYEDLSYYFEGFDGCFVMLNSSNNTYTIYNKDKITKRLPPNSSFKIINSLIGLECGVVKDENSMFKWDGTKHGIEAWNKDHTLATAIAESVVWYYKRLAAEIGYDRMKSYIDKVGYGNCDISGGIDKFWLQSSLEVSPMEQINVLEDFYYYQLPFAKENTDIVKKILVLKNDGNAIFSGKTGTGMRSGKEVNGWFVGYVERADDVYFFATNIEGKENASGPMAKSITIKLLQDKGIL